MTFLRHIVHRTASVGRADLSIACSVVKLMHEHFLTVNAVGLSLDPVAICCGLLPRTESPDFQQAVLVPLKQETHGGEDVALYAQGPMAHLVRGVLEQNVVAHILDYAACLGDSQGRRSRCLDSASSSTALFSARIAPWAVTIVALLVTALR